jgi:hypothetical protein
VLVSNAFPQACKLSGPPSVTFDDPDGQGFIVDVSEDSPCGTGALDPPNCVEHQPIELAAEGSSFSSAIVTIAIANANNFDPVPTPTRQAHAIVLKFPGASGVVIPLDQDVTLIPSGQVLLYSYGPAPIP